MTITDPPPGIVGEETMSYSARKDLLLEALGYIARFRDAIVVVKYGGAAMVDEAIKRTFTHDMVLLQSLGMRPVIVHGGGPEVSRAMKAMGQEPHFVEGLRVTTDDSLRITEMVLSGTINKEIVANIIGHGGRSVGLSGKDGPTIHARKMNHVTGIDLGHVGEIQSVDPTLINLMLDNGFLPVISPIGIGANGQTFNINADTAASRIAAALNAEKIIFMTDVRGILDDGKLISTLTTANAKKLIDTGVITGGMLPKVEAMLFCLNNGVTSAHIIGGNEHHAVISELFTDKGTGTIITP